MPFQGRRSLFFLVRPRPRRSSRGVGRRRAPALVLTGLPSWLGALRGRHGLGRALELYPSFVNVGQTFYGFGWESLLLGRILRHVSGQHQHAARGCGSSSRGRCSRLHVDAGSIRLRGDQAVARSPVSMHASGLPAHLGLPGWPFHWMLARRIAPASSSTTLPIIRAILLFRASASRVDCRDRHDPVSGCAHRERQPLSLITGTDGGAHYHSRRSLVVIVAGGCRLSVASMS